MLGLLADLDPNLAKCRSEMETARQRAALVENQLSDILTERHQVEQQKAAGSMNSLLFGE